MSNYEEIEEAAQLAEILEFLLKSGEICRDSAAGGIARQVIGAGAETLTGNQRAEYERVIFPLLEGDCCQRCGQGLSWSDRMAPDFNDSHCSYCTSIMAKDN